MTVSAAARISQGRFPDCPPVPEPSPLGKVAFAEPAEQMTDEVLVVGMTSFMT